MLEGIERVFLLLTKNKRDGIGLMLKVPRLFWQLSWTVQTPFQNIMSLILTANYYMMLYEGNNYKQ